MVGATQDPTFGHLVVFGAGGTLVELLNDVAFRIHPLSDVDAHDMLTETRTARLLEGFRGAKAGDITSVEEIVGRVSAIIAVCPEIRELDMNPVKVLENGAIVVDARIRVEAVVPGPPSRRVSY
jgi:acetyltransferase